jgi:hypothetical protein
METIYRVNLMPIEPILFSDNRSARAGEDHLIRDQDPSPHTIYGAIGACIAGMHGVDEIDHARWAAAQKYLGDFVADIRNGAANRSELLGYHFSDTRQAPWFPRPRHMRLSQRYDDVYFGKPMRITPQQNSSLKDFAQHLSFEADDHEAELEDFISADLLRDILCGVRLSSTKKLQIGIDRLPVAQCYQSETRLGLGMDNDANRPRRGLLFSRPYRRFRAQVTSGTPEWRAVSLAAYFKTIQPLDANVIAAKRLAVLGGDRGRALIAFQPISGKPLGELRQAVQQAAAQSHGFFCYLLTPAVREGGWPEIGGVKPIAAAIGKEATISGWNSDRQNQHPRPIRKLVPAGSTFFYPWPGADPNARAALIENYWLEPVSKSSTEHYRNSGFGRMLIGVWKNEN